MSVNKLNCLNNLKFCKDLYFAVYCNESYDGVSLYTFQEAGIPIDMVGGVSIGAFMGALWCAEKNITTMTQKAREWSQVCSFSFCF
jgi:Predicted esterase of the alpha-beta hydrolase superfamily